MRLTIPLHPVPASRPRVSRAGFSFYVDPYKSFKKKLKEVLPGLYTKPPITGYVVVSIECRLPKPPSSKIDAPHPDVDNFAKAVLDGLNEIVIDDDRYVTTLTVRKVWVPAGDSGSIIVNIHPDPNPGRLE